MPYSGFASIHKDPEKGPVPGYSQTTLLRELPDAAIEQIVASRGPSAQSTLALLELRHLGGALGRPSAVPNAVGHRDAAFNLLAAGGGGPDQAPAIRRDAAQAITRMQPWSDGFYTNFLDFDQATPEEVRKAYDPGVPDRLARLEQQVDPTNLFRLNLNIPPTGDPPGGDAPTVPATADSSAVIVVGNSMPRPLPIGEAMTHSD
jgi:hypothetical protein